jgi:predicted TIM-barrel fold metal-dependent hydrolase
MILDVNAYLGPFAFRALRHDDAAGLLARMDAKGIGQAVVSSALAITYRNTQPANERLAAEVKGRADRLIPFAVINPAYAGWEDDLRACRELGFRGLRLYPKWHGYALSDAACLELVDAATALGMPISIPIRVEDVRNQSWLVDVPEVPLADVAALVAARPNARFIILNGAGFAGGALGRKGALPANYLIEISRMDSVLTDEIGRLAASLGADRLAFGTGAPFHYPDLALLKLEVLRASEADKARIARGNAAAWLGLDG